jgi:hypothetical protein
MGDELAITVIATGFDSSRKRDTARTQSQVPVEVASGMRVVRDREAAREAELERVPTAIPVGNGDAYNIPTAASAQPRANPAFEVRRGPQNELEDLDIPAFLRRNR